MADVTTDCFPPNALDVHLKLIEIEKNIRMSDIMESVTYNVPAR